MLRFNYFNHCVEDYQQDPKKQTQEDKLRATSVNVTDVGTFPRGTNCTTETTLKDQGHGYLNAMGLKAKHFMEFRVWIRHE